MNPLRLACASLGCVAPRNTREMVCGQGLAWRRRCVDEAWSPAPVSEVRKRYGHEKQSQRRSSDEASTPAPATRRLVTLESPGGS